MKSKRYSTDYRHHERALRGAEGEFVGVAVYRCSAKQGLEQRHHLRADQTRLAVADDHSGAVQPGDHRAQAERQK